MAHSSLGNELTINEFTKTQSSSVYDISTPDLLASERGNGWRQMLWTLPDDSKVLDVGCSTGYLGVAVMTVKDCVFSGIEIDQEAAAIAARSYLNVYVGNVEDVEFLSTIPEEGYDAILLMDILEHVDSPGEVLRTLRKKLSENGLLIVNVPNVAHWSIRFELLRGRFDYRETGIMDHSHKWFFTHRSIRELVESCDLNVCWIAATSPGWERLMHPLRILPNGGAIRLDLLKEFPELLSRQFLIKVEP